MFPYHHVLKSSLHQLLFLSIRFRHRLFQIGTVWHDCSGSQIITMKLARNVLPFAK